MIRTFAGVLVLAVMINIMNLVGIQAEVQRIIQGAILLLAIFMDSLKKNNTLRNTDKKGALTNEAIN